ncbi:ArsR/SmtB family transcription factor [Halobellus limi]|jgi:predicted transcriptional regulator|uniref:ArsR family transcriptional regulator n=1 Tax=Halobellus limi TaxID=699433 RepID=A0A1H5Z9B7_9EURY|nr:helix-turn-helix domain-containing protein [Halobellus limi]QCC48201.1 ArsR family transcriptional regulator [Halobellus limi]SEG31946.1 Helix-turn-helix domain-containing protein [Halobellus limi]
MSGVLPPEPDRGATEEDGGDLRVLPLDDDEAARLINCLAADTARSTLTALQNDPATASELADGVGTSLQNVRHHLDNLREAGLVRVVDTRYSVKGREMKVYAPTRDSLVVCVGDSADVD